MKQHAQGFLGVVNDAKTRIKETTPAAALTAVAENQNAKLVDVREAEEFNAGHVKGAVHLGKGVIERDIEKAIPDPATPLYLYCGGGFRSALAADNIQKMGYTNVYSIDGGWRGLQDAGAETE